MRHLPHWLIWVGMAGGLAGCGDDGGGLAPQLVVSTTTLDFGDVSINTRDTLTFSLANTGGGEIEVNSVSIVEGEANIFTVSRDDDGVLGADESFDIAVSFGPRKEKPYTGRIQVRTDVAGSEAQYVDLTGVGAPSDVDADGDGYSPVEGDCNDGQAASFPGNVEVCDGIDNNCDTVVPSQESDSDYDGYRQCATADRGADCDDGDPAVHPGAEEICDNKDTDCDGTQSDNTDQDQDGVSVCGGDCDDLDDAQAPGQEEKCDGLDNDCNNLTDDRDNDGDGFTLCHPAGDCDDDDPLAHPAIVDPAGEASCDGSPAAPCTSIQDVLAFVDDVCRTIFLVNGNYSETLTFRPPEAGLIVQGQSVRGVRWTPGEDNSRMVEVADALGPLTLRGITFSGGGAATDGGAISSFSAQLNVEGCVFEDNSSTGGDGGAIAASGGHLHLVDVDFLSNVAGDDGGAVAITAGELTVEGGHFSGNSAVQGGAIFLQSTSSVVTGTQFDTNSAATSGGAIGIAGSDNLDLRACSFINNEADSHGGAISLVDSDSGHVVGNVFVDNTAGDRGGALHIGGAQATLLLANNTIVGSQVPGEGAALMVEADSPDIQLISNILGWSHGKSAASSTHEGVVFTYTTVFYTTSGTSFTGALTPYEAATAEGTDVSFNDQQNPRFITWTDDGNPANDNLHLASDSPCKNSGPEDDTWNDVDQSRNDRGAYGGPDPYVDP